MFGDEESGYLLSPAALGMSMDTMASTTKRRRVAIFVMLGVATVVLIGITISLPLAAGACHGPGCPSGGGAASGSGDAWPVITGVAAVIAAIGTLLQGIAAFRKTPTVQVAPPVPAPPTSGPSNSQAHQS